MTEASRGPDTTGLSDSLREACEERSRQIASESIRPLNVVRSLLDAYEREVRAEVEVKTLTPLFAALGQACPVPRPDGEAKKALQAGLRAFLAELDEGQSVSAGPPPLPPARPSPPPLPSTREAVPEANRLIAEVRDLTTSHHPLRLHPLLQALAAEVRYWQEKIHPSNPLYGPLSSCIPKISRIRREAGIDEFVRGLSQEHRADWGRLAAESRRKVKQFDDDAGAPLTPRLPPKDRPSGAPKSDPPRPSHTWPAIPNVRGLVHPVYLVGGVRKEEKLDLVKDRFGVHAEWVEVESQREAALFAERVKGGTVGAVLHLSGLTGHAATEEVRGACAVARVPFARADRGGTGDLEQALLSIERQLAAETDTEKTGLYPAGVLRPGGDGGTP